MIIHAVSIHSGGGKILLDQLLTEKDFGEISTVICDTRYVFPDNVNPRLKIIRISPTLHSRWHAEFVLKEITDRNPNQTVLCFSNLPPAFRLKAKVILYLQNALLLPSMPIYSNSLKSGLRTFYERVWLNLFWKNIDEVWVQTKWLKEALLKKKKPIYIKPIFPKLPSLQASEAPIYDFITVTGSVAHKRLNNLLESWLLMPDPAPSLLVVTDGDDTSFDRFKHKNITFKINLSRTEIYQAYQQSKCLILTSKLESFCLPIYEAIHFKLKLIVPNEKYAKEACMPDLFINPESPVQMQRDITAFLNGKKITEPPLKILNVNMTIDPIKSGGTGERTVQMSKALTALGHQCSILTLNLGITEARRDELSEVELTVLPCLSERFYIPLPNFFKISRLVQAADIVHLMGHWTLLNAITYFYIKKYKKKYVACPAGALPLFGRSILLKKIYNFIIGKRIVKDADYHFVITKEEIPQFAAYGVSTQNILWIPNGIDPASLQERDDRSFRQQFGLGESPFIFYIGRLNPIKGPDLLIEAFSSVQNKLPDYKLVMAGFDEGMLHGLKKYAQDHGVADKVHFIGHVSGAIKSQALHAATLMVIPSRLEAMSIVVLEGGAVGLPVLLTDKCGLNHLQALGAGIVVPATAEGITKGLIDNLSQSAHLQTIGKTLQHYVYQNYLWPSVAQKIADHYRQLVYPTKELEQ